MAMAKKGLDAQAFYVDMENLQADGQSLLQSLMDHWPEKLPAATRLNALCAEPIKLSCGGYGRRSQFA